VLCNRFFFHPPSETLQSSPAEDKHTLLPTSFKSSSSSRNLGTHSNTDTKMENKSHYGSSNPTGKRSSPVPSVELPSQHLPKSNRPSPALPPVVSPLLKKRRAEVGRGPIPTILVEDEPMEEERPTDDNKAKHRTGRREGRVRKNKQGQPLSAEEGRS